AVRRAEALEMVAELWAGALPRADADIRVLRLREDPAVAARDVGELDDGAALVAPAVEPAVGRVSLVGHAVHDAIAEAERLRGRSVGAVGADDDVGIDRLRVDGRPLAHLDAPRSRRVEEEGVESPPLRHQDHGLAGPAHDRVAVAEAQL